MVEPDVDVVIVGAGLSGIGMACQLVRNSPDRTFAILERRSAMGGTWDLFRYPGIRCDSDMHTLGYGFRPWPRDEIITDAASINRYIADTAAAFGVEEHVRYRQRVVDAAWSTVDGVWTVTTEDERTGEQGRMTCRFVVQCTGYYSYDMAHTPELPGLDQFEGHVAHPQFWPQDLDVAGARVVVIGSGATAITLVPAMSRTAEHVTMLQRSPGYILTVPATDPTVRALRALLPDEAVSTLTRHRNALLQLGMYQLCQRFPRLTRSLLLAQVRAQVGRDVDMVDFTPSYDPWDERLCVVPDGDLFAAVRTGDADVVTDQIDTITRDGIRLRSGRHLDADVIVTATGLQLQLFGGMSLHVDGEPVDVSDRMTYRGAMLADVPNLAMVFGYVNVSWTRKVDLVSEYVCRVLNHMQRTGARQVVPRHDPSFESDDPFIDMQSGYIQRARHLMPRQGTATPWRNSQNVLRDMISLRWAPLQDGHLHFGSTSDGCGTGRRRGLLPRLASQAPRLARRSVRAGAAVARHRGRVTSHRAPAQNEATP